MLSVDKALATILDGVAPVEAETVALTELTDRIAAASVKARMTQPPFAASAMDGYAVQIDDARRGARLTVIGEAPAGSPFSRAVGAGEAVRIFTGSVIPDGADHVVIQEDVKCDRDQILINEEQTTPRHIRKAGIDFHEGDLLISAGEKFHEIHCAILAAANIATVNVVRKPRVALFSNGDELREPGGQLQPGQIINSNHYAVSAMIRRWGGKPDYLGRASDSEEEIASFFKRAAAADVIVPIGGASVGDYDFVKSALKKCGGETVFENVAVRPGKPTWFGKLNSARVVGLPGNPASAIVTAALFVQALVRNLAGQGDFKHGFESARLQGSLPSNGLREAYLRANSIFDETTERSVVSVANQDSSLLSPFSRADMLIRRMPNAKTAKEGDEVEIVRLR